METQLRDSVALVTGGGSGIGRATALALAREGAHVVVADLDPDGGQATVETVHALGREALYVAVDVSNPDQVAELFRRIQERFGRLDIGVNNAGIGGPWATVADYPLDGWRRVMAVNLEGVLLCMQQELRQMVAQGGGAIVNVASIAGVRGLPYQSAYTASKHAVIGLTRSAAQEYARHGIRVNAVCPVYTRTPLFEPMIADNPRRAEKMLSYIPMRRFGEPEDVADAIVWLCSARAGFITGQAIHVDGGMTS